MRTFLCFRGKKMVFASASVWPFAEGSAERRIGLSKNVLPELEGECLQVGKLTHI